MLRHRIVLTAMLGLLLSACGFHMVGEAELPPEMAQTRIIAQEPYSHFVRRLTILLEQNGARVVDAPPSTALLEIPVNEVRREILSIGDSARVREFRVVHKVRFRLLDEAGNVLVPEQNGSLQCTAGSVGYYVTRMIPWEGPW